MRIICICLALLVGTQARAMDVWFIDVEGGAATLLVTPAGESILIDTGNPGPRDADRIHKVATEKARLKQIDHLFITHWHLDHYGGVPRLAKLMPILNYYDRGIPDKLDEDRNFAMLIRDYKAATGGKSKTVKAGDVVKLKQKEGAPEVSMTVLCASEEIVKEKPGAKENEAAKGFKEKPIDKSDNAKSLGFLIRCGDWKFLDLGDLTWNVEYKLVHPTDRIGPVDVYQVTHHGQDSSNHPALINTVKPRVAVMNNGAKKGGHAAVMGALRRSPEMKAIYQLHRNVTVGAAENTEPELIANPDEKCKGESIALSVAADSRSYTLTVGGEGKPRRYETRR